MVQIVRKLGTLIRKQCLCHHNKRRCCRHTRNDGSVAQRIFKHKCWPLTDTQRMKLASACASTSFDLGGLRVFEKLIGIWTPSHGGSANLRRYFPTSDFGAFSQRCASERQPDAVISHAEIFGGFGHEIWRGIFCPAMLIPTGVQKEGGTDHCPAATVKPFALLTRDRKPTRIHQREFPDKLDVVCKPFFKLFPSGFSPITPRRNDFDVIGDFHSSERPDARNPVYGTSIIFFSLGVIT